MENKLYYTPQMEEFHVGFEYEIFEDFDTLPEPIWHPQVYGKNGADPEHIDYVSQFGIDIKKIRVRFLDKEDIESLGFKWFVEAIIPRGIESRMKGVLQMYIFGSIVLYYSEYTQECAILLDDNFTLYWGFIKNKSELKKLMSQLGITITQAKTL